MVLSFPNSSPTMDAFENSQPKFASNIAETRELRIKSNKSSKIIWLVLLPLSPSSSLFDSTSTGDCRSKLGIHHRDFIFGDLRSKRLPQLASRSDWLGAGSIFHPEVFTSGLFPLHGNIGTPYPLKIGGKGPSDEITVHSIDDESQPRHSGVVDVGKTASSDLSESVPSTLKTKPSSTPSLL